VLRNETTAEQSLEFTEDVLSAPPATPVTVEYLNDSAVVHNIAFYLGEDASAPLIAATELGTGPDNLQTTSFTTPEEPGSYYFHCDVHPTQMQGTLEIA
jgi:plastocyanin